MKKIVQATAAALIVASASAFAWWGPGGGNRGWDDGRGVGDGRGNNYRVYRDGAPYNCYPAPLAPPYPAK
ncbi:MAG: hypothetical protein KZQ81_14635 [Candidatus Thiodiazotropha sp. (ex Rostrolucina anterorostrata)]|nr:hypothetical protein [Candidatus Thiodiazotropha sp. (ex Rostrolucina anterorostrata)]